jgi:hypothetical protein
MIASVSCAMAPEPLRDLSLLGGYRALFNELFTSS